MFILNKDFDNQNQRDSPLLKTRFEAYKDYLKKIGDKMPSSARDFALADWHYDFMDHKCPHDSWVEHLKIYEESSGDRRQNRVSHIEIKLLGAWHDGYLELMYKKTTRYSLTNNRGWKSHGDWLYDEVRLSEDGFVLHEIEFVGGIEWLIECEDIEFKWLPFEK
jgi:hypothetical protein